MVERQRPDLLQSGLMVHGPSTSRWIVSRRFDLTIVAVPLVAAVVSLATLGRGLQGSMPLWGFLLAVVAFDVAHVWATLYLTYLDPDVLRRRRLLLLLTLPVSFLVAYRIHLHSSTLFWTLLAYVAIFHFIKQQYGFIALYKMRAGERSTFDFYIDKWTLWAGALGPVLLWHASPARQFDWFNADEEFIARIDPAFEPEIIALMALFAVVYLGRQIHRWRTGATLNHGKNMWMVASWISWSVGLSLSGHPFVSAAFINLLHGVPFLALVWYRCNRRWQDQQPTPGARLLAWLSQRRHWLYFYGLVLVLALLEETLWDGLVWRVYLPQLTSRPLPQPGGAALSLWVALLSLPQIAHYYLDAWLWKLDGSNPDLVTALQTPGPGSLGHVQGGGA